MKECSEAELTKRFQYDCGAPVDRMRFACPGVETYTHFLVKDQNENLQLRQTTETVYPIDTLPSQIALNIVNRWVKHEIIKLQPYKSKVYVQSNNIK